MTTEEHANNEHANSGHTNSEHKRKDDPAVMAQMRKWLTMASKELDLDPQIIADVEKDLLRLTGFTAHNISRPGTPLTAFLVGLATNPQSTPEAVEQIREMTLRLQTLGKEADLGEDVR
ncbi:DUF6457 domain-containing protein [Gleimia hominis]|uniref:DUF6457 domain-containing protein n=1 Tax=Gleimia hominis TaxID=595468 RepID=A0ABU3IDQ8_9ACTO|nr:DUF6457 domain-containing protein [Gleimia hominis]MDT3767375.1 DUF6457 domain-containing protein [Gleimia hominis]